MALRKNIGRRTCIIDCRETMSLKTGGGLAQSGTFAEANLTDIVVIAMSPHRRHIPKPVCVITQGLREAGFNVSVLVLNKGQGIPPDSPLVGAPLGAICEIRMDEIERINNHRLAIIHLGSIKQHILYKAKYLLAEIKIPVIVICQAIVDFKDFNEIGAKISEHALLKENKFENINGSEGIVDIISGVVRGLDVEEEKLTEIVNKVKKWL